MKKNRQLILELDNPKLLTRTYNNLFYQDSRIKKVTILRKNKDIKISFWLKKDYQLKSFFLSPSKKYPHHRLVIDIKGGERKQLITKPDAQINNKKVIIIDAGHGGEDPGAVGKFSYEKNIVLSISKKLATLLQKNPKFEVVLTRSSDYYVKLSNRPTLAQNQKGDAFLSIHADSALRKSAKGASVYTLSKKGGATKLAKKLEQSENADDIFGNSEIEKDWVLNTIMRDLARENKKSESFKLANNILRNLGKIGPLHKKTPQKANFAVLKAPAIPSVLVEVAFLSNKREEKRLNNPKEQQKIAKAIYQGIVSYFK